MGGNTMKICVDGRALSIKKALNGTVRGQLAIASRTELVFDSESTEKSQCITDVSAALRACLTLEAGETGMILTVTTSVGEESERMIAFAFNRDKEWTHIDHVSTHDDHQS